MLQSPMSDGRFTSQFIQNAALNWGQSPRGTVPKRLSFNRIWTDTRTIEPDDFFVAITGDVFDGHKFIPVALERGVKGFLVETAYEGSFPDDVFVVRAENTLDGIRGLAGAWRKTFTDIPVVAIAGSVGKTITKDLLTSLLRGKFCVASTHLSQNGYLGVALSLLGWEKDIEAAVVEVGIDSKGTMAEHLTIIQPTHGLITALGPEHLDGLKTVDEAINEELELVRCLDEVDGIFYCNLDEPVLNQISFDSKVPTFSLEDPQATFVGKVSGGELYISSDSHTFCIPLVLPGAHNVRNLLAAASVAMSLGVSGKEMESGLANFRGPEKRCEVIQLEDDIQIVSDTYNANPTSMIAAFHMLSESFSDRTPVLVLGDMLELGTEEEEYHRSLKPEILLLNPKAVFLYGPKMKWLYEILKDESGFVVSHTEDKEELSKSLWERCDSGDIILIKGSREMRMETLLECQCPKAVESK